MIASISLALSLSNSAALDSEISFSARALKHRRRKRVGLSSRWRGHGSSVLHLLPIPSNMSLSVESETIPKSRIRITRDAALIPNISLISTSSAKPKFRRRRPTSSTSSSSGARKAPAKRLQAFSSGTSDGMLRTRCPNSWAMVNR